MSQETDRINTLERLPRRRRPERDLWPGIAARLPSRRASRHGRMQLALAASMVAGLAAVFTVALRDSGSDVPAGMASAALPLTDDSRAIVKANLSLLRDAERELQQALRHDPDSTTLRSLLASTEHRERALRARL